MKSDKETSNGMIMDFFERKLDKSSLTDHQKKGFLLGLDLIINIIFVVFLVVVIRTYIMTPFQVYGISMCDTLNYHNNQCQDGYGDYIIINKSAYLNLPFWTIGDPERGDIVVFRPPHNDNEFYIKRIIGLPGEKIQLNDGKVFIFNNETPNGFELQESYLSADNQGKTLPTGGLEYFEIPEGKYFVLGDNRRHSSDSRICFKESVASPDCGENGATPYISLDEIEGKAAIVLWPFPGIINGHSY